MTTSATLAARHEAEHQREAAILDEALALVLEAGYDGTSLDELARRAHVSKTTLYARWPGKPALVGAALARSAEADAQSLEAGGAAHDHGSLRADLVALGAHLTADRERSSRLVLALASAVQAEPAVAAAVTEHLAAPFQARSRAILDRAVARGELPAGAADLPYAQDLLPSLALTHLLITPAAELDVEAVVDRVLLPVLTQPIPRRGKARP